uniref:ABC transporter domain-containing protein n=1 Tax=Tetradesmus obliquus TaxID=3088 RepID=A0A383WGZ5_TETOB|eukprot:jgi/Sobl393_1/9515/SZX76533.1
MTTRRESFDTQLGSHAQYAGTYGAIGVPPEEGLARGSHAAEYAARSEQDSRDLVQAAVEEQRIRRQKSQLRRRGSLEVELPKPDSSSAAAGRLPRSRSKGSRLGEDESTVVVDVTRLHRRDVDPALRRALLDEALETQEQDNEELLNKFRQRLDRAGVQLSRVEVKFTDLNISADVLVGSRGMPTVANAFIRKPLELLTAARLLPSNRHHHTILQGVTGVLRPGRLTLLLGPPGSGKTMLLKALAGQLRGSGGEGLNMRGAITYNGETFDSFQVARTSAYISQDDNHQAELTVRETLDFAARCLGVGHKQEYADQLRAAEKAQGIEPDAEIDALLKASAVEGKRSNIVTDLMLRVLGLEVCADTMVGGAMMRGVSGGQRKRVTTGEMMVGPAKTLLMDEISTGLDSSTTYLIVRCIRNYVHLLEGTVLMSLLQPPPEVFELFDDVMLLSEGQMVYHGPRQDIVGFFAGLGFAIPPRKGVADFLQEVTSRRDQQQYWARDPSQYSFVPVAAFHAAYEASPQGSAMRAAVAAPAPQQPPRLDPLVRHRYALSGMALFKASLRRDWTLVKRNSFLYIFKTCQVVIIGLITGTLFLKGRIPTNTIQGGTLYLGLIFFSIVHLMFASYAEQTLMIASLGVFFKQRTAQFFPAWAFCAPTTLLRVPYSLLEGILWASIVYWLTGMAPDAGRFFIFLGYLALLHQMGTALFRLMGALGREISRTNVFGSFALVLLILLGGFALKRPDIHPWWIWMYWASPITYATNALAVNEMSAPRWSAPFTAEGVTRPMGEWVLLNSGMWTQPYWRWMPALVLLGYWALFNAIMFLALQYLPPPARNTPLFTAEYLADREVNRTGTAPAALLKSASAAKLSDASHKSSKAVKKSSSRVELSKPVAAAPASASASANSLQDVELAYPASVVTHNAAAHGGDGSPTSSGSNSRDLHVLVTPTTPTAGAHHTNGGGAAAGGGKGLALPFKPMSVAFKDICYYVDAPAGAKGASGAEKGAHKPQLQLLHNITGSFRPGVLTALMGVSGAGKTTLMDVLAGRKTSGRVEGQIWVGGHPKQQHSFARVCGYVEQTDIHTPRTTVREALVVSATLRLYDGRERHLLEAFVDDVLQLVELGPNRDTLVGVPGEWGLSIEQRKRLTIAVELVANPSVVFMDEPTSGLDARAAAIVMRAVRNTVDTGRTVVCTIHQPSIHIFDAFDELLLLKRGGRTIFHGALGADSSLLIDYFTQTPGVEPPGEGFNPSTWMLDVSAVGSEARLAVDFADVYEDSQLRRRNEALVEQLSQPPPGSAPLHFDRPYAASTWQQFSVLMRRWLTSYWRNPGYNATRIVFCVVLAVLLGTIYLWMGQRRASMSDVTNIMGALFICITFLGTSNASGVQPIVATERPVFYRELAAGMYSPLPFAVAQVLVELPYVIVQALLYGTITYMLVHFELNAAKFWWYILFTFLTLLFFTYYGMMSVAISANIQLASIMSSSVYSLWFLMAGFFIPYAAMPPWWSWYYWLNPLSYMLYGIITSQLGDVTSTITVAPGETSTVQELLRTMLGFQASFVGWCALIMAGFILAFVAAIIGALRFFNFQRR